MSECGLVNLLGEGVVSLIVHRPTPVDELELSRCNKSARNGLHCEVLVVPPHLKESLLYNYKPAGRVSLQTIDYGREQVFDLRPLYLIVHAIVELIDCL
jgi:hypothetical protein